MVDFVLISSVDVASINPDSGTVIASFDCTLQHAGQVFQTSGTTSPFSPSIANLNTNLTTAAVTLFQQNFGSTIARNAVVIPAFQNGV